MALQSWRFESGPENANLGEEETAGPDNVTWGKLSDFSDFLVSSA